MDTKKLATIVAVAAIVVGCSGSSATSKPTATPIPTAPPTATPVAPTPTPAPALTVTSFTQDFSAMASLQAIHSAGSGMVGVILPDTTSSARYVSFDAPYLKKAFEMAGYADTEFKIQNAQGSDATELAMANADITAGAKVLVVDPIDSTVGKQIQAAAAAAHVAMISYDRATFQGATTYYVSFDNVQVGKLIGQGFMDCVTAWNVTSPNVFELDGGTDSDPNAIDFAKGYNSVIWGSEVQTVADNTTNSAGMKLIHEQPALKWDNKVGGTIFKSQYTAHPEINATVEANDGLANAVITDLKAAGAHPGQVPTVGQDATLQGMEWILQNWQCGSVYKPVYMEAQDAVALASYLRAGQTPPATLVNGTTKDPTGPTTEPASLLVPLWANKANMEATVIADKFVDVSALCTAVGASVCTAAGIH